ncbi:unnamed protein product [Arctogadus glacialis]
MGTGSWTAELRVISPRTNRLPDAALPRVTRGVGVPAVSLRQRPPPSHGSQGPELAGRATTPPLHNSTVPGERRGAAEGGDVMLLTRRLPVVSLAPQKRYHSSD